MKGRRAAGPSREALSSRPALQPDPPMPASRSSRPSLLARSGLALFAAACALPAVSAAEPWPVVGQQGLVRMVIVPAELAADQAAYEAQIARLCEPERTCFLNFYTNSSGAPVAMPLPDAISHEATATYRRSMKNGVQVFLWSCRLQVPGRECF